MFFFKTSRIKWTITFLAGTGLLTASFFLLDSRTSLFSREGNFAVEVDSTERVDVEIKKPTVLFGMIVDSLHVLKDHVRKNQRLADLFKGNFVSAKILREINLLPRKTFDFRKISAGKKYTLLVRNDSLRSIKAFVYEPNPMEYIVFHLEDSLMVESFQRELIVIEKSLAGVIQSSLSETIQKLGITPELTNKFVDIFAWQVDFQRLQKGDRFKLLYEENQVEDQPIGIGKIGGIYFEHEANGYYAFPFDQGDGLDYFDEKGNSLRKALLKYPIEFTRISSRYNLNRFHPIARVFRAHLGTDFAAPEGTPIRTAGDGIVEEAQYKTNSGNYVKVRHNSTYTTQYLHMSRIGPNIKPGLKVRQGETIGYVGSTGLATGPHLCYRFWKNGIQVDALKVELPPSQPLKAEKMDEFQRVKNKIIEQFDQLSFPASVSDSIAARN